MQARKLVFLGLALLSAFTATRRRTGPGRPWP